MNTLAVVLTFIASYTGLALLIVALFKAER